MRGKEQKVVADLEQEGCRGKMCSQISFAVEIMYWTQYLESKLENALLVLMSLCFDT